MYIVLNDRILWIYFIVTLFFIIIGLNLILTSSSIYSLILGVAWLFGHIALMFLVYYVSLSWSANKMWLFINLVYIALIFMSLLWVQELDNIEHSYLRTMSGIIMILGGLLLLGLGIYPQNHIDAYSQNEMDTYPQNEIYPQNRSTWYYDSIMPGIAYLLLWFGLTLYVLFN